MYEFIISIGLNDKDTHKQEISTSKAKAIIYGAFGDCTIMDCRGRFTHESGAIVYEKSCRVYVYAEMSKKAELVNICKSLKVKLNQETIILDYRPCDNSEMI